MAYSLIQFFDNHKERFLSSPEDLKRWHEEVLKADITLLDNLNWEAIFKDKTLGDASKRTPTKIALFAFQELEKKIAEPAFNCEKPIIRDYAQAYEKLQKIIEAHSAIEKDPIILSALQARQQEIPRSRTVVGNVLKQRCLKSLSHANQEKIYVQ